MELVPLCYNPSTFPFHELFVFSGWAFQFPHARDTLQYLQISPKQPHQGNTARHLQSVSFHLRQYN